MSHVFMLLLTASFIALHDDVVPLPFTILRWNLWDTWLAAPHACVRTAPVPLPSATLNDKSWIADLFRLSPLYEK